MADSNVRVPPDSTGKKIDASSLDVGVDTVYRQRIVIADNSATAQYATVTGGALLVDLANSVNISAMPTVTVTGGVAISGTAQVAISTPFTVNNISATVTVAGSVGLIAGTANIGSLNHISRTVQVAVGTPFTLQGISTTVQVAIATPFTINNISATVNVAGTFVIDTINAISRTVQVAIATPFTLNNISATVNVAGTFTISTIDAISATVQVAIATPFTLNNISATVTVAGVVGLAAGTANIGFINNISATVVVAGVVNISATHSVILAAGTANFGTLNDISRTVQVAVGTPFTVNNISASVVVTGLVGLTAGTANIGHLNHISRTVEVAIATPFTVNNISATVTVAVGLGSYTPAIMSVSHGPKCVTASTSAVVTLIASPGAGASIHITQLLVGNASATLAKARIGTSASANTIVQPLAASGGGFVFNFDPPWKLSASEAALCSVKPNVADVFFTVNFFVAA